MDWIDQQLTSRTSAAAAVHEMERGSRGPGDMDAVRTAEFKEAFDEFDKVNTLK